MATADQIRAMEKSQEPVLITLDGKKAKGRQTLGQATQEVAASQQMTRRPLRDIVNGGPGSENKPKCQRCNDTNWVDIWEGHPQYEQWAAQSMQAYGVVETLVVPCPDCVSRRQIEYLARLQEISGLSPTHRLLTLDMIETGPKHPRTKIMVEMAQLFISNPYGVLTFHGPYGNGKTTTLMAIVNACVAKGIPAVYIEFRDLIGYARAAFNSDNDSDWERIRRLAEVQVLCIDEMSPAQLKETDYVRMIQSQIINARYLSGEAGQTGTVVAGNFVLFDEGNLPTLPDAISTRLKQGVTVWNDDLDFRPQLGERK